MKKTEGGRGQKRGREMEGTKNFRSLRKAMAHSSEKRKEKG